MRLRKDNVMALACGLILAVTVAAQAAHQANQRVHLEDRIVISGCKAEDDCVIDYKRAPDGKMVWVLKRVDH